MRENAGDDPSVPEEYSRKLHASETRFYNIIEKNADGIVIVNYDGVVFFANRAASNLFDRSKEELVGSTFGYPLAGQSATELDVRQPSGETRTAEMRVVEIEWEDEPAYLASLRDITARKQMEQDLKNSQSRLQALFNHAQEAILLADDNARLVDANPAAQEFTGYTREELLQLYSWDLMPPDQRTFAKKAWDRFRTSGVQSGEFLLWGKDANVLDVEYRAVANIAPNLHVSILRDITERKRSRQALEESERKFRSIVEQSRDGIRLIDAQGTIIEWNQANETITGLKREDALGRPFWDVLYELAPDKSKTPAIRERIKTQILNLIETGDAPWLRSENRLQRTDGTLRIIQTTVFPIQTDQGTLVGGIVRDVTERKRAEQALHQRQRELEALLEINRELSSILDLNDLLHLIASHALELLEADESLVFLLDDDGQTLRPLLALSEHAGEIMHHKMKVGEGITGTAVAQNRPLIVNNAQDDPHNLHFPNTARSGRFEHVMSAPLTFRGKTVGAMAIDRLKDPPFTQEQLNLLTGLAQQATIAIENARHYQEITIHRAHLQETVLQRTAELRNSREFIEAILTSSPDSILFLDTDGTIQSANASFERVFGYPIETIHGTNLTRLIAPENTQTVHSALQNALDHNKISRVQATARRANEQNFDAIVAFAPVGPDITNLVCSFHDISALKQVERMKDAFISNISHELRTPIASIKLYHDLLARNPAKQEIYMDRLQRETERLWQIVKDVLYISSLDRGEVALNWSLVNINTLTDQSVTMRGPQAQSQGLTLHLEKRAAHPTVRADEDLLGQALDILLTNAVAYTPSGGKITVTTLNNQEETNNRLQLLAGISVSDTGPGIDPQSIRRVFDRFFRGAAAQKTQAPGTGLGLATAYEIVQRHNGWIEVISEGIPGKGTTFTIWLPTDETT